MNAQRKPAIVEFWLALAACALLIGIGLLFVAYDIGGRMDNLRQNGVVSAALIESKNQTEGRSTEIQAGGGRLVSRSKIVQSFDLSFDLKATMPHSEYSAGMELEPEGRPIPYPYTLIVGPNIFARYEKGDTIMVTFIPGAAIYDKDNFQLSEIVNEQGQSGFALWLYLAACAGISLGLWAGYHGWKLSKMG